jgi:hypothetical protein
MDDGHLQLTSKNMGGKRKRKNPNFQWIIPTLATLKKILEKTLGDQT